MSVTNLAFYRFVEIDDCEALAAAMRAACEERDLLGTIIIAQEGLNGMVAGRPDDAEALVGWLRDDARFATMPVKCSTSEAIPFRRLRVKVKPEIATMRTPGAAPVVRTAAHVAPVTFREWLRRGDDLVLIDTRNDFEVEMGTFRGAINPRTTSFNEFPSWVRRHEDELRGRKVVMFCTGGIRCEKAAIHLREQGLADVLQLKGGILKWFEEVGGAHYSGDCFVFDDREALTPSLEVWDQESRRELRGESRREPRQSTRCSSSSSPRRSERRSA